MDDISSYMKPHSLTPEKLTSTRHIIEKTKNIGQFILGEKLGEGTFGVVRLATHILTGEKVAVKILEKRKILEEADVTRIEREIKILKLLHHNNIVQLYSVTQTSTTIYLIMEYASGKELFDYIILKKRLPEVEACKFYQQIISGVDYLHKLKVVHRDLKPENLLLDSNKDLKIADFGLSNLYPNNELLTTACGSPCYAAPEMINGKAYKGVLVDIWSSGIILFAMICGYLPFEDADNDILYKKITEGKFAIPKYVSEQGKDLLRKVLNVDPCKRYNIAQIKKHPWFNLVNVKININEGLLVKDVVIPVDEELVVRMEGMNFIKEEIRANVLANKHNHITTTYYLLLRGKMRKGEDSVAIYKSEEFVKYIHNKNNAMEKYNGSIEEVIRERAFDKEEEEEDVVEEEVNEQEGNVDTRCRSNSAHVQGQFCFNNEEKVSRRGGNGNNCSTHNTIHTVESSSNNKKGKVNNKSINNNNNNSSNSNKERIQKTPNNSKQGKHLMISNGNNSTNVNKGSNSNSNNNSLLNTTTHAFNHTANNSNNNMITSHNKNHNAFQSERRTFHKTYHDKNILSAYINNNTSLSTKSKSKKKPKHHHYSSSDVPSVEEHPSKHKSTTTSTTHKDNSDNKIHFQSFNHTMPSTEHKQASKSKNDQNKIMNIKYKSILNNNKRTFNKRPPNCTLGLITERHTYQKQNKTAKSHQRSELMPNLHKSTSAHKFVNASMSNGKPKHAHKKHMLNFKAISLSSNNTEHNNSVNNSNSNNKVNMTLPDANVYFKQTHINNNTTRVHSNSLYDHIYKKRIHHPNTTNNTANNSNSSSNNNNNSNRVHYYYGCYNYITSNPKRHMKPYFDINDYKSSSSSSSSQRRNKPYSKHKHFFNTSLSFEKTQEDIKTKSPDNSLSTLPKHTPTQSTSSSSSTKERDRKYLQKKSKNKRFDIIKEVDEENKFVSTTTTTSVPLNQSSFQTYISQSNKTQRCKENINPIKNMFNMNATFSFDLPTKTKNEKTKLKSSYASTKMSSIPSNTIANMNNNNYNDVFEDLNVFDLNSVVFKTNLKEVKELIVNALMQLKIKYRSIKNGYACYKTDLKFQIEICKIEEMVGCAMVIRTKCVEGNKSMFSDVVGKIMKKLTRDF